MPNLFLVMIGGALGAGLRYGVGRTALSILGPGFPWGTLVVNLVGGLCAGLAAGLFARQGAGGEGWRLFLVLGVLGGFTTFSAFSLETGLMLQRGEMALAALYILASVIGSVALLFAGLGFVRALA